MKSDKLFYFILLSFSLTIHAMEYSGSVKSFPQVTKYPNRSSHHEKLQNVFKIQLENAINDQWHLESMLELSSHTETHSRFLKKSPDYRIKDFSPYLKKPENFKSKSTSLETNLNKLNLNYKHQKFDFSFGRQINTFGVSKTISPNDILVPTQINSLDKEDRTGIDSINLKIPLDELSIIESGIVLGKDLDQNNGAIFIRPKLHIEEWDIAFMAMEFKEDRLLGLEVQHPYLEAGWFLETQWVETHEKYLKDFTRTTFGFDYKFSNSFYYSLEYHYNGSSINNTTKMPKDFIFLKNNHYTALTHNYELTPLLISSSQNYYNFKDHSLLTHQKIDYNLTENSYLGMGIYLGLGPKNSEFKNFGTTYYSSIRYYF